MKAVCLSATVVGAALWFLSGLQIGTLQDRTGQQPQYPRVTLSTWYEVDPSWPNRPEGMPWGETPGVAVDADQRIWVYTRAIPPVQVYDQKGRFLFAWGEEVLGPLLDGMVAHQIRFDQDGNVWLVDLGNHVVLKLDSRGRLLLRLGTPGEPGCDKSHFNKPTDVAIAGDGHIFVSDGYGNARIVHFDPQGRFVSEWGSLGTKPGQFSLPHSIAVDSKDRIYVADRNNARIQVFDRTGKVLAVWQNLCVPWGLCMLPNDRLWVCGCSPMEWRETDELLSCPPKDQLFMCFDTTGRVLQLWTVPLGEEGNTKPGELCWVHGIAVDNQGNIYACDIKGHRVQKFVRHN